MGTERLKASKLQLDVGGQRYWTEVGSARLVPIYRDVELYGSTIVRKEIDAWRLEIVAVQSMTVGSLWRATWDSPHARMPFRLAPEGNIIPTMNQPHFAGQLVLGPKPALGGDAAVQGSHLFETVLQIIGEPELITS